MYKIISIIVTLLLVAGALCAVKFGGSMRAARTAFYGNPVLVLNPQ